MDKIKVLVLMGGRSPEHEISVISGQNVVSRLDPKKYEVLPMVISKTGERWQLLSQSKLLELPVPLEYKGTDKELVKKPDSEVSNLNEFGKNIDVVFIAMHGPFGEDGTIQGMLDLAGIKYTGSGVLASSLGMDKLMFRKILKSADIAFPPYLAVNKDNYLGVSLPWEAPYFVKPSNQGSSVGNSLVKQKEDMEKAVKLALKYSDTVLIDKYIKGLEVTCGVLGNDDPITLPLVEIHPLKGEFFDYESKYTESGSEEIVPARVNAEISKKVQEIALKVYKELGCRGFGRVDFILEGNKKPYVLEINTIPGLTPMSLLPKAANAAGIEYPDLLNRIIGFALEK